jgi:hypothetical protein
MLAAQWRQRRREGSAAEDFGLTGNWFFPVVSGAYMKVKDEIMYTACFEKFRAHPALLRILLDTGDVPIVEVGYFLSPHNF